MNDFNRFGYCDECCNNNDESKCKQCYRGSWFERDNRDDDEQS